MLAAGWSMDSTASQAKKVCFAPSGGVDWLSHSGATASPQAARPARHGQHSRRGGGYSQRMSVDQACGEWHGYLCLAARPRPGMLRTCIPGKCDQRGNPAQADRRGPQGPRRDGGRPSPHSPRCDRRVASRGLSRDDRAFGRTRLLRRQNSRSRTPPAHGHVRRPRRSTALSARLDPEDLREIIGAYHRCAVETVSRFGGIVAKYMGDGVLVYFGYPQAHEDDADRAVRRRWHWSRRSADLMRPETPGPHRHCDRAGRRW